MMSNVSRRALETLTFFGLDGARMLEKAPRIAEVKHLSDNLEFWLGKMPAETLHRHPDIAYWKPDVYHEFYNNMVKIFSIKDVGRIAYRIPDVMARDWSELEEKIHFALFTILAEHPAIIRTEYLRYPIEHIHTRFELVRRTGLYVKPNRKDKLKRYVLPLRMIVEENLELLLPKCNVNEDEYFTLQAIVREERRRTALQKEEEMELRKRDLLAKGKYKKNRNYNGLAEIFDEEDDEDDEERSIEQL